ncbi:hypothetical protein GCM10007380_27680 [Gottfriedia solisilvae]|uniref:Uncharacterized protein n=1 Tax=Gottfriedia solisilvae TaxID=1516104 RepID=A0A8J3EZX0_9BACI|nr:hypothetical protein GCM10007380_27680 [Gottfriedia solisilvae]
MRRKKNGALILVLFLFLIIFIIVNAIRHIKIYMVYSSGLMPFIIVGITCLVIILLFFGGSRQRR